MPKIRKVCGKKPVVGRIVSDAHNVRPRRFEPTLQVVRASINGGVRRIRVCTRCRVRTNHESRLTMPSAVAAAAAPKALAPHS